MSRWHGSGPGSLLQPGHRRLPARRWPSPERCASTREQHPRPSGPRRSPSAGSRLPAGRDQPYRHEPLRPRLRCAARHPGVRLNLDLVRQVERLRRLAPGREIGLRLNPRAEPSRNAPGAPPGTRDRIGRRSPASTPSPSSSAGPAAPAASATGRSTRAGAELPFQIIAKQTNTPRFHPIELPRREIPRLRPSSATRPARH